MSIETDLAALNYTYPVDKLRWGHCYGNAYTYASLDGNTDLLDDQSSVRYGLRESTNQRYYLLGWKVGLEGATGKPFLPVNTTFAPAYQETKLLLGDTLVAKKFLLPFENHDLRSAHYLLDSTQCDQLLHIRSRMLFPEGVEFTARHYEEQRYLTARFPDGTMAVIWGSDGYRSHKVHKMAGGVVKVILEYAWEPTADIREFGLSYAYAPLVGIVPLNSVIDVHTTHVPLTSHLKRIHLMLDQTQAAIHRYLETAHLLTPDSLLNRAVQWAKVNQLRDQQEYRWGSGFSNNPPSDTVVGRDSVWYLMGSSYYAQAWSKKLFEFWFRYGYEAHGKFTEYLAASREPVFKDDYGLNINDNTPLFLIAAHQYYSLTRDKGFLYTAYPLLLNSANYILEQRRVGENNHYGLVWCTSTEKFVRGLCGWRNCIRDYSLSGAVTEVNVECVQALRLLAELAREVGDNLNKERLAAAAENLRQAVEKYLRSTADTNPFYYLNIDPAGEAVPDMTGDLVFPILFGVSDHKTSVRILTELFDERFWVSSKDDSSAGGIRTVSSAEPSYTPRADPDSYGLMGGVWPNVALWAARAAAYHGMTDLSLKALKATFRLSERKDPARFNVVPGQLPEYLNADNLVQRGRPRSTFLFGIFIWAALESCLGLVPHADRLEVNPVLPKGWEWAALSNLPYGGYPLGILADGENQTLYTTARVDSQWRQVVAPVSLQQDFRFESEGTPFWMVVPGKDGKEVLVASTETVKGKLYDRKSGHLLAELFIPAGCLARQKLP